MNSSEKIESVEQAAALYRTPQRRKQVERIDLEEREMLASKKQTLASIDVGSDDLALTSNWMRRANWIHTYKGADRSILKRLTLRPYSNGSALSLASLPYTQLISTSHVERRLLIISEALDQFFDQCEDTIRHTDNSVLWWLRGIFLHKPYKAPFQLAELASTRARYRSLWKRFVFFVIRLYCVDDDQRKSLLQFQLWHSQRRVISKLWNHRWWNDFEFAICNDNWEHCTNYQAKEKIGIKEDAFEDNISASDEESDGDEQSSYEDSEETISTQAQESLPGDYTINALPLNIFEKPDCAPKHTRASLGELSDLVGELSASLCTESFVDCQPASTLIVYFSGILGLSPDGSTFLRPKAYTSSLSALIYSMRLILLEATAPRFEHPNVGWSARPRTHQLDLIKDIHERYMCNSCQAPMGELLSLRSYGRAVSRTDGPSFRVRWSQDGQTVTWDDGYLPLN